MQSDMGREISSLCCFSPQMAVAAGVGPAETKSSIWVCNMVARTHIPVLSLASQTH